MKHNKAFVSTRWRLVGLYVGTMAIILTICGLSFYEAVATDHWQALNRKLTSLAGTLHDGVEPALTQPGEVAPIADHFLPGLICFNAATCPASDHPEARHIAGVAQQNDYYVRFLSPTGTLLAASEQQPAGLPAVNGFPDELQTVEAADGTRYRQVALQLKTQDQRLWGYIQVGQSLKEYEDHLLRMQWMLGLGMPTAMIFIGVTGWWLSSLAMQPVYQSYRQIQQFTADAAHELRTPLATIRSTVEFTLDEPDLTEADAKDTLRTIERQTHRLSQLAQDLLLLSRIDLHLTPAKPSSCCLNQLVEDLADEFSALALASHIDLQTKIEPLEPLFVSGNEEQLYRLFANLVMNAIQYTPAGGHIEIRLQSDEHHASLYVQDTGIGIPPTEQANIFDRFYRVNSDRSRQTGGAGLGLSIAQAIALAHKGSIQVHSEVGKGSKFMVRLPLKPAHKQAEAGKILTGAREHN